jgi:choline monooxygenase
MLDPAEFHVDEDVAKARTLPARAFTDPAFLNAELATIFARNWLFAAPPDESEGRSLAEMLVLRGSHLPLTVLDQPLFLQRDWQGRLRCFPNVCTHAWFPLVHGPGRERVIVCRQHGRRFDTQGRFVSQPGFAGGCPEDDLPDLPVAEWGPFLFVGLGQPAMPFAEAWKDIDASAACLPLAQLRRRPAASDVREVDGNWKQHAWNYMDVFHLTYIHRAPGGLVDALDMDSYRTELSAGAALQWAYANDPAHGFDPSLLPARFGHPTKRVFALWWFVFPNLTLNFYPWGLSVNVYMPVPGKPNRTQFLWRHYVFDEARYERIEEIWLNRQVDAEDVDAIRQVSRGARSSLARPGRFAPGEETGPHWFHRLVYAGVFGSS